MARPFDPTALAGQHNARALALLDGVYGELVSLTEAAGRRFLGLPQRSAARSTSGTTTARRARVPVA